jgi:hypothetical protein
MTVDDIVDEVLEEFDFVSEDARESAYSFAGTGPFTSEVIDFPSGSIIAEIEYLSNADYDMQFVGESTDDVFLDWLCSDAPNDHSIIEYITRGSYLFTVETAAGADWEVALFHDPPEPVNLPIQVSGRGCDIIGPINHVGFMTIEATTLSPDNLQITTKSADGRDLGGNFHIESSMSGTTQQKVLSTKSSREFYPWVTINFGGEWEISLSAHK